MVINQYSLKHNHYGDTIIEVLIVLAILGSGLAISYSIASKSLLISRDAQERTEATTILEAQIEQVRAVILNPTSSLGTQLGAQLATNNPQNFCFYPANSPNSIYPLTNPVPNTLPTECQTNNIFSYYITYSKINSNITYTAICNWENVFGTGMASDRLVYKIYSPGT